MSARNRMESLDAGAPVNLSPYPPVSVAMHRAARLAYEELRRQEAEQRRWERNMRRGIIATILGAIITVVHP